MDISLYESTERILLAALLGAVIGFEREWSGKSAGFRTMMLVSVGSALFTIVSFQLAMLDNKHESDVTRIASNIVTGIGFLGAGLIFRGNKNVHNLTTAAAVWTAAAIGMAAGIGSYWESVVTTALVILILVALQWLEEKFERAYYTRKYKISYHHIESEHILHFEDFFDTKKFKLLTEEMEKDKDIVIATWNVRAKRRAHDELVERLLCDKRVQKMEH
jgi:putative Mg2+ transporter-C (MgtC) family protein